MSVKNQRLAIALAVVATLAGKESLDYALGLSSTLEGLSSANAEEPDSNTFQVVSSFPFQFKRAKYPPREETVLFPNLPPIIPPLYEADFLTGYDSSLIFSHESDQIFVPASGMLLFAGLSTFSGRRRK